MIHKRSVIFHEVQQFSQVWLWLLILFITGIFWYGIIQQIIYHMPLGRNPAPDLILLIFWLFFGIFFPLFFYSIKLVTEVRGDGLYIRFFPFHFSFRRILLKDIKRHEVRTYSPIREHGGWGIRYGLKGKAYNVCGNRGVQLEFVNGKRLLIGSQRSEEFVNALDRVKDIKT
ncbi:hypothetical protein AC481_07150 [miscellaneous Crenarchaeota group archaeon SMTZ-80]|nr:MAG: hypothetical protein AC481_07150 [miscellaneous Crenarchaeota group archaeon SMTZ-80]